jgi:hypothetical protein
MAESREEECMTIKRAGSANKGKAKKLSLKKETLKDLEVRDLKGIKGGMLIATGGCRVKLKDTASRGMLTC